MPKLKIGTSKNGERMHYSVGAIIEQEGKFLLIDRKLPPFGFAGLAGHIDVNESSEQAMIREVKEESGLTVTHCELVGEEELIQKEACVMKVKPHYWYVFRCDVTGTLKKNGEEEKSIGWYTKEEMKQLTFEDSWDYWLKKLKIL